MKRLRYAIIGAGAIGGYYGGLLCAGGREVCFLAGRQANALRQSGLLIESAAGQRRIETPSVFTDAARMPRCDVALVCLKTTANHRLPQLLPPVAGPTGIVVLLQNGLDIEREAIETCGRDRVLLGVCWIALQRDEARIHHVGGGRIVLGSLQGTGNLRAVARDLHDAGLTVSVTDDLRATQWRKLLWNAPFNPLSVLLPLMPHDIASDESLRPRLEAIMSEVLEIAAAERCHLDRSLIQKTIAETAQMPPYVTSMRADFDRGRPLEWEAILAAPLRIASACGLETPHLQELREELLDRVRGTGSDRSGPVGGEEEGSTSGRD